MSITTDKTLVQCPICNKTITEGYWLTLDEQRMHVACAILQVFSNVCDHAGYDALDKVVKEITEHVETGSVVCSNYENVSRDTGDR